MRRSREPALPPRALRPSGAALKRVLSTLGTRDLGLVARASEHGLVPAKLSRPVQPALRSRVAKAALGEALAPTERGLAFSAFSRLAAR